jgi:hypothetical protein
MMQMPRASLWAEAAFPALAAFGIANAVLWIPRTAFDMEVLLALRAGVFAAALLALVPDGARAAARALRLTPLDLLLAASILFPYVLLADLPAVLRQQGRWALIVSATIEELVFRVALPIATAMRLSHLMEARPAALLAQLLSQGSFALCHSISSGGIAATDGLVFMRFFGAGCCLAVVREKAGVSAAAAMHVLMNAILGSSANPTPDPPELKVLMTLVSLLLIAWTIRTTVNPPTAGTRVS